MSRWLVFCCSSSYRILLYLSLVVSAVPCTLAAETDTRVAGTNTQAVGTRAQRIDNIKAAFVLNIVRFTTWPDKAFKQHNDRLLLCYYRSRPFAGGLDTILGKSVAGRKLDVVRIDNVTNSHSCQILVFSQTEVEHFSEKLLPDPGLPLLTIADRTLAGADPSLSRGVMVSLVRKGSRIGFEIDLQRTRKAGLKMSSELLKHAQIVGGGS